MELRDTSISTQNNKVINSRGRHRGKCGPTNVYLGSSQSAQLHTGVALVTVMVQRLWKMMGGKGGQQRRLAGPCLELPFFA